MRLAMTPTYYTSLGQIKRKRTDDNFADVALASGIAAGSGSHSRRHCKAESPAGQKSKHAKELAKLCRQSEILRQQSDLGHDEKHRRCGAIYSRRSRIREKEKFLQLQKEIDCIQASNMELKVDNSRLEAILSVVAMQISRKTQQTHHSLYAPRQPMTCFPSVPLPQLLAPCELTWSSALETPFLQQPLPQVHGHSPAAISASLNQPIPVGSHMHATATVPFLPIVESIPSQTESNWESLQTSFPHSHENLDLKSLTLQHCFCTHQPMLSEFRYPIEGGHIVPNSGQIAVSDALFPHNTIAPTVPMAWSSPSTTHVPPFTRLLDAVDCHHDASLPLPRGALEPNIEQQFTFSHPISQDHGFYDDADHGAIYDPPYHLS